MLQKLNEYRDLIGLIVFFLGGFFWIENHFATKGDLVVLDCKLGNFMKLTQLEIKREDFNDKIRDIKDEIGTFSSASASAQPSLSPSMQQMLDEKEKEEKSDLDDLRSTNTAMVLLEESLARQECEQLSQK